MLKYTLFIIIHAWLVLFFAHQFCFAGETYPLEPNIAAHVVSPTDLIEAKYALLPYPTPSYTNENLIKILRDEESAHEYQDIKSKIPTQMPYFDFNAQVPKEHYALIKLSFDVYSHDDSEYTFYIDGRMWLYFEYDNQSSEIVGSQKWLEKYANPIAIKLKKGSNIINVSLIGRKGSCTLSLSYTRRESASTAIEKNWLPKYLGKYLYVPGQSLKPLLFAHFDMVANPIIFRLENKAYIPINQPLLDPGIYELRWQSPERQSMDERFAIVSTQYISDVLAELIRLREQERDNSLRYASLDTLLSRLQFLSNPRNRRIEKLMGERQFVELLYEATCLIIAAKESPNGIKRHLQSAGFHFDSYINSSGEASSYLIYIPKRGSNSSPLNRRPLIIVYPSSSATRTHFYDSYILDFRDLIHSYTYNADKYGMVVIFPYGRNMEHSSAVESDIIECVRFASLNQDFIPSKIMAIGACGAGRDALIFSARNLELVDFAASFETTIEKLAPSPQKRRGDLATISPIDYARELSKIPVYLAHSDLDRHVSKLTTLILHRKISTAGGTPILDIIKGADEGYFPDENNQWIAQAIRHFNAFIDLQHDTQGIDPN